MTDAILATTEYGNPTGAPVVALHGGRCTRHYWQRTATEGIPRRRWICPDLRGHGASTKERPWTLTQLARDVVATLDAIDVQRVDVIGASLGGAVAFALARLAPARVRSLTLVDPAVSTPQQYHGRTSFHALQEADTVEEFLEPRTAQLPPTTRQWAEREVQARLERTPSGRFQLRSHPEAIAALQADTSAHLPPDVGAFRGPALLLASGRAALVTESGKQALHTQLGDHLRVVTCSNAGHSLLWDAYAETVAEIGRFLDDVDRTASAGSMTAV